MVDNCRTCSWLHAEGVRELRLSPGRHTIRVMVLLGDGYAIDDLWFVAAPHGEYEVNYESKDWRVAIWIVDKATGRPVGGIKGSDDEPPDTDDPPANRQSGPPLPKNEI